MSLILNVSTKIIPLYNIRSKILSHVRTMFADSSTHDMLYSIEREERGSEMGDEPKQHEEILQLASWITFEVMQRIYRDGDGLSTYDAVSGAIRGALSKVDREISRESGREEEAMEIEEEEEEGEEGEVRARGRGGQETGKWSRIFRAMGAFEFDRQDRTMNQLYATIRSGEPGQGIAQLHGIWKHLNNDPPSVPTGRDSPFDKPNGRVMTFAEASQTTVIRKLDEYLHNRLTNPELSIHHNRVQELRDLANRIVLLYQLSEHIRLSNGYKNIKPRIWIRSMPTTIFVYSLPVSYQAEYMQFSRMFTETDSKYLRNIGGAQIDPFLASQIGGLLHGYLKDKRRSEVGIIHTHKWLLRVLKLVINFVCFKSPTFIYRIRSMSDFISNALYRTSQPVETERPTRVLGDVERSLDAEGEPIKVDLENIFGRRSAIVLRSMMKTHVRRIDNLTVKSNNIDEVITRYTEMRFFVDKNLTRYGNLHQKKHILVDLLRRIVKETDAARKRSLIVHAKRFYMTHVIDDSFSIPIESALWLEALRSKRRRVPLLKGEQIRESDYQEAVDLYGYETMKYRSLTSLVNAIRDKYIDDLKKPASSRLSDRILKVIRLTYNKSGNARDANLRQLRAYYKDVKVLLRNESMPAMNTVHLLRDRIDRIGMSSLESSNEEIHGWVQLYNELLFAGVPVSERATSLDMLTPNPKLEMVESLMFNNFDLSQLMHSTLSFTGLTSIKKRKVAYYTESQLLTDKPSEVFNRYQIGSHDKFRVKSESRGSKISDWLNNLIFLEVPSISQIAAKLVIYEHLKSNTLFDDKLFIDVYIVLNVMPFEFLDVVMKDIFHLNPPKNKEELYDIYDLVLRSAYQYLAQNQIPGYETLDMLTGEYIVYIDYAKRRLLLRWIVEISFKAFYGLGTRDYITERVLEDKRHAHSVDRHRANKASPMLPPIDMYMDEQGSRDMEDLILPLPSAHMKHSNNLLLPAHFEFPQVRMSIPIDRQPYIFTMFASAALENFFTGLFPQIPHLYKILGDVSLTLTDKTSLTVLHPDNITSMRKFMHFAAYNLRTVKLRLGMMTKSKGVMASLGTVTKPTMYLESVAFLEKWLEKAAVLGLGGRYGKQSVAEGVLKAERRLEFHTSSAVKSTRINPEDEQSAALSAHADARGALVGMIHIIYNLFREKLNSENVLSFIGLFRLLFADVFAYKSDDTGSLHNHDILHSWGLYKTRDNDIFRDSTMEIIRVNFMGFISNPASYSGMWDRNLVGTIPTFLQGPEGRGIDKFQIYLGIMWDLFGDFGFNQMRRPPYGSWDWSMQSRSNSSFFDSCNKIGGSPIIASVGEEQRGFGTGNFFKRIVSVYIKRGGDNTAIASLGRFL